MSDSELLARIAELEHEMLSKNRLILALSDRILGLVEILGKRISEERQVKCYLVSRHLGRKCEGLP